MTPRSTTAHARARTLACLALVTIVFTAACGSDDEQAAPVDTTAPASSTSTTSSAPPPTDASTTVASAESTTTLGGGGVVVSEQPTTTAVASGLVLRADGLGLVGFGAPMDEVVATLTTALGAPTFVGEPRFDPLLGSIANATWAGLGLEFTGDAPVLTRYTFSRAFDVRTDVNGESSLVPLPPAPWELSLATELGVTVDSSTMDAAAAYPSVFLADCAGVISPTVIDETGVAEQIFLQDSESGLYLFRPVDGVVELIGAQAEPNPLKCDGAAD